MTAPVLYTDRLILKRLSQAHLSQAYVDWLNDKNVYKYLETGGDYTLEMLENYLKDTEAKDILFWAIHLKDTGAHIGNIKIDPVNQRHGLGEYGILMGDKNEWGKGYAKEASRKVIDFCFQQLDIRKIVLGVVADNMAAVLLYKQLGFNEEGVYKRHGLYEGKYCDMIRMACFNPEFKYTGEGYIVRQ